MKRILFSFIGLLTQIAILAEPRTYSSEDYASDGEVSVLGWIIFLILGFLFIIIRNNYICNKREKEEQRYKETQRLKEERRLKEEAAAKAKLEEEKRRKERNPEDPILFVPTLLKIPKEAYINSLKRSGKSKKEIKEEIKKLEELDLFE